MRKELLVPLIREEKISDNISKFIIEPLEKGFGRSIIGNSLRVTLLQHVWGYAITDFEVDIMKNGKYEKIPHYFCAIEGFNVDILDIFLKIKNLKVRLKDNKEEYVLEKEFMGPCTIYSQCLTDENVFIVGNEKIFSIEKDMKIKIKITIKEGRGYELEEYNNTEIGKLIIDANFNPVKKVGYHVEPLSLEGKENYEKLILTIETYGTYTPMEVLNEAINMIFGTYDRLIKNKNNIDKYFYENEESQNNNYKHLIDDLGFSVRVINALKGAGIKYLEELCNMTEKEVMQIKNLGKKSFLELSEKMKELNLEFKK